MIRTAIFTLAMTFTLTACQTAGQQEQDMALASPPLCSTSTQGVQAEWCMLYAMYQVTGREDPCVGLSGRQGHDCRISELHAYHDPVDNPLPGDFVTRSSAPAPMTPLERERADLHATWRAACASEGYATRQCECFTDEMSGMGVGNHQFRATMAALDIVRGDDAMANMDDAMRVFAACGFFQ